MNAHKAENRDNGFLIELIAGVDRRHTSHALSLNDICDALSVHASEFMRVRGATPPARNHEFREPGAIDQHEIPVGLGGELTCVLRHLTRSHY